MSYVTRQRQVLGAVFEQAKRPLTPCEIRDEARKEIPSLGIATVYRAINRLVADGQVRPVEVPGAGPHYERAGRRHHHFFLCHQCKRLFDLIGCVQGVQSLAPSGFRVRQHEIVLYGECVSCAEDVAATPS
jgi:Fur family ferric uptake transcriptional regulator